MYAAPSFGGLMLLVLLGFGGSIPLGIPPAAEDPMMARVAPGECLFYATWAGTAEPSAESTNHTERLLAEPQVRRFADDLQAVIEQSLRRAARDAPPESAALLRDLSAWQEKLIRRAGAVFVTGIEPSEDRLEVRGGLVLHLGDEAGAFQSTLVKHQERLLAGRAQKMSDEGRTWYVVQPDPRAPQFAWGVVDDYLVVGMGEGSMEETIERMKAAAPPAWLTAARELVPIERRAAFSHVDVRQARDKLLPLLPSRAAREVVELAGLQNVSAIVSATGLDEEGMVSKTVIAVDGEPQGLLGLAGDKALTEDDLAPIPAESPVALATRFDAQRGWELLLAISETIDARAHGRLLQSLDRFEVETGVDIERGVVRSLGDVWRIHLPPSSGGIMFTGLTLVVDVEDHESMAESLQQLRDLIIREGRNEGPQVRQFRFAGEEVNYLDVRQPRFPLAPAWCLTDKQLVVGLFPQAVKDHLARGATESLATAPRIAELMQAENGPMKLAYVDARKTFEAAYPLVLIGAKALLGQLQRAGINADVSMLPSAAAIGPHLQPTVMFVRRSEAGIEVVNRQTLPGGSVGTSLPVAAALLLPAVQSAREAAQRAQSMNNLKQMMLAMHNYHDTYRQFPPQFNADENGKPLLSWRVHILPFVEQAPLYQQFHLDEPWDSEHNRKLIAQMPPVYRAPGSRAEPGETNYLGVSGEGALLVGKEKVRIADIIDGTSNTIMLVEAGDSLAVPWTKPDDFDIGAENPMAQLMGLRQGGFLAGFADGSVRFISQGIDPQVLKALFTRGGGEVVGQF